MTFNNLPDSERGECVVDTDDDMWERVSDYAILGVPTDVGSERAGQRLGPDAIRDLEAMTATYDLRWGIDINSLNGVDCGNTWVHHGDVAETHEQVALTLADMRGHTKMPIVLGGDHSITPHVVRGWFGDDRPVVVHLDAHADIGRHEEYLTGNHASWVRYALEQDIVAEVHTFGVRALACREDLDLDDRLTVYTNLGPSEAVARSMDIISNCGKPVYLTVDLDVVDPAFAPGVVYPEPGGWTPQDLIGFIVALTSSGAIRAMDVVELCPTRDASELTVRLAHRSVLAAVTGIALHQRLVASMQAPGVPGEEQPDSGLKGDAVLDADKAIVDLSPEEGVEEELVIEGAMPTRGTAAVKKPGRGRGKKTAAKRTGRKKAAKKGVKKVSARKKSAGGAARTTKKTTAAAKRTAKKAATKKTTARKGIKKATKKR